MPRSPTCRCLILLVWVLTWARPGAALPGEPPVLAAVVTVVGLDAQGNPGPRGLGVIAGRGDQMLTSASLLRGQGVGVVKTARGKMRLIQQVSGIDPARDLAVVRPGKCGSPVEVAGPRRLRVQDEVSFPAAGKTGLGLQKARVTGFLPLSPRLNLIKIDASPPPELVGTPLFNPRGELVAMLHAFAAGADPEGLRLFLELSLEDLKRAADPSRTDNSLENVAWQAFWEGVAAGQRQDWSKALERFSKALKSQEKLPEAYCGRGVARHHLRDYQGALQDLEEAGRRLPNYGLAYLWLGKTWERQGNREAARKSYEQAAAAEPELSEAWFHLGLLAYQAGRLPQAQEYLQKAKADFPRSAERWWYLGNLAQSQDRTEEALEAFRQAIALDPGMIQAYLDAGQLLLSLGRYEEGAQILNRALAKKPLNYLCHYYLALCHLNAWNQAQAWEEYFTLQKLNPGLAACLLPVLERSR